ncbi:MAG: helix-turn-helix domain-containing protein, partial [Pseudomonadota bacterium]
MPWQECDRVSLRAGFVALAGAPGANLALLCRRFGISRGTGYKWLRRYREAGVAGLGDRSRRPASSPTRTAAAIEQRVLTVRQAQPCWGGRKIRGVLLAGGEGGLEPEQIPAASTITAILRRHGRLDAERTPVVAFKRFEADAPNRLWQMDFKGHFALDG